MSDSAKKLPLTHEQKLETYAALRQALAVPVAPIADVSRDPNLYTYVVAFDGTWNDRLEIDKGSNPTHVDRLERVLSESYAHDRIEGAYYNGVGTRTNFLLEYLDGATGRGTVERAEKAYEDFRAQAQQWVEENPDARVHVHAMGFSRGAASARHFLNLVDERGVGLGPHQDVQVDYKRSTTGDHDFEPITERRYESYAIAPGQVSSSAILFDTVATGQTDNLKLEVPASTRFVAHLVSLDEERYSFPLATTKTSDQRNVIDLRNVEFPLPGAHSDIGGTYAGGMRDISGFVADTLTRKLGLPVPQPVLDENAVDNAYTHDSRWAATRFVQSLFGREDERRSVEIEAETRAFGDGARVLERIEGTTASEAVSTMPDEIRDAIHVRNNVYSLTVALNEERQVEWSTSHPGRITFDAKESFWELDGKAILPLDSYLLDYLSVAGTYEMRVSDVQSLGLGSTRMCVAHEADRPLSEVLSATMSAGEWTSAWTNKNPQSLACPPAQDGTVVAASAEQGLDAM
jgi:hypothetical protein